MDTSSYTIRPVAISDAPALRALRFEALSNHPSAIAADPAQVAAESDAQWGERITGYLTGDRVTVFVAETPAGLAGMAGVDRGHWPNTRHSTYIWGVYVRPDWRGTGAAGALLQACEDWAQALGVTILKLGVAVTNIPAIRSYAKAGFTVYGVDPRALRLDGKYIDELLMAKVIGE